MAKKSGEPKKSVVLKNNIFNKAISLFTQRGFENVKVTDICEALDISTGTFYYYFPSKESVFLTYYQLADEISDELASSICAQSGTNADKLMKMFVGKVKAFSVVGQKMGNICMTAFLKHYDDSSMDIHRSAYVHFMRIIEEGQKAGEFRSDLDAAAITSTLRYIVCGLALHWTCSGTAFDIDLEAERQARQFIKTITAIS